jgi:MFS family permease
MAFRPTWQSLDRQTQINLGISFGIGWLFWTCMACQLPVIPLYADSLGASADQVGWVMGAFAVGLLLFRSRLGRQSDQLGRVQVMRVGLLVATIIPLYYALFPAIPLLFVFRAVHGISIAAFATSFNAFVADLAPLKHRGELVGYMSLVNPLGVGLGPILGDWLRTEWHFATVFCGASLLGALGFALTWLLRERRTNLGADALPKYQLWRSWGHPRVRTPALVLLLIGLSFGSLSTFMPLFLRQEQIPINSGWFYLSAAIAGVLVRLPLANWSDRWGRGMFVSIGICGYASSMWLMYNAQSPLAVLISGALEGTGAGFVIPSIITIVADRTTKLERGYIIGLVWSGFDVGIALAGPVVGGLVKQLGLQTAFAVATGLSLLALLVFLTQSSGNVGRSWRFATGRGQDVFALDG